MKLLKESNSTIQRLEELGFVGSKGRETTFQKDLCSTVADSAKIRSTFYIQINKASGVLYILSWSHAIDFSVYKVFAQETTNVATLSDLFVAYLNLLSIDVLVAVDTHKDSHIRDYNFHMRTGVGRIELEPTNGSYWFSALETQLVDEFLDIFKRFSKENNLRDGVRFNFLKKTDSGKFIYMV